MSWVGNKTFWDWVESDKKKSSRTHVCYGVKRTQYGQRVAVNYDENYENNYEEFSFLYVFWCELG